MNKLFAFIAAATLFTSAHSGIASGSVRYVTIHSPDILMFSAGPIGGGASCASGTNQWAIKLSDPAGKGFLAVLLTAQSQGKPVYVQGYTNTCRDWGDRELPTYIAILD